MKIKPAVPCNACRLSQTGSNAFELGVAAQRFHAFFPAKAGAFIAPKRQRNTACKVLVDVDLSRVEAMRQTVRVGKVPCVDTGYQPEAGAVGQVQRLFQIVKDLNGQHGPKISS